MRMTPGDSPKVSSIDFFVAMTGQGSGKRKRVITPTDNLFAGDYGGMGVIKNGNSSTLNTSFVCVADTMTEMLVEGSLEYLRWVAWVAGRIAATAFRVKYNGNEPRKEQRLVSTFVDNVPGNIVEYFCVYSMEDKHMVQAAITSTISNSAEFC